MHYWAKITPIALLAALLMQGCQSNFRFPSIGRQNPPLQAVAQGEMVHLTDRTPLTHDEAIYDTITKRVNLFSAANEVISFQVVVEGPAGGAEGVTIAATDLAVKGGPVIPAANVSVFRMLPVKVTEYPPWYLRLADVVPEPASFYDALVPVTAPVQGQPYRLEPGQRVAFWVDIAVPRSAAAGTYSGEIRVAGRNHQLATLPVSLKVYNFVLGDERPVAALGGIDYRTLFGAFIQRDGRPFTPETLDRNNPLVMRGLTLLRQLMVLSHEHRLDLFDRHMKPLVKRDMAGRLLVDWEDYDAIVGPYLTGTAFDDKIGVAAWPLPFNESWPEPSHYGGIAGEDYQLTVTSLLAQSRQHLAETRGFGRQIFIWPVRKEVSQDAYDRFNALGRLVRMSDDKSPILLQLPPRPPELTGWRANNDLNRLWDIVAAPGQYFDPADATSTSKVDSPLAGAWLSPGLPPYLPSLGVIATPADVRAIPWFAMKYGCAGLLLPEVLNWSGEVFQTPAEAQTRLFYPGASFGIEGVLPSVRLKRLRRGLQDLAYLQIVRQREKPALAKAIINSLVRYGGVEACGDHYLDPRLGGWEHSPAAWETARRMLAEEITALVHPSEVSNQDLLAQRLAWKDFEQQTHTVRLEQARCKLTPASDNKLNATITLDLYNEHGRDIDLLVQLEQLPEGWKATTEQVHLAPMPAFSRRVVTLSAQGLHMAMGPTAKLAMPLTITVDRQRSRKVSVALPFLISGQVQKPPAIDGNLNDWPMRAGNGAGDFRLLGARGQSEGPLAKRGTLAFVMHDSKNLYLAFRCQEPEVASLIAQASNVLHYEQLMACGEDMVEVILDPGCQAKGPQDLYHLAVKANGVLLAERGVRSDPPLGAAGPWPVAVSVAIKKQEKHWIVELAIPLESFGPAGKSGFWGVNFTRFATSGAESSSWAEAARYFYDPRNLGTMYMVPSGVN